MDQVEGTGRMELIFLKACRRCKGDVVIERDVYGEYAKCVQCGRSEEAKPGGFPPPFQNIPHKEMDAV